MLTIDAKLDICETDSAGLLDIAARSVLLGLQGQPPYQPLVDHYSVELRRLRSSCVTLKDGEQIFGRAATLRPTTPLVCDVNHNAYEAACHISRQSRGQELSVNVLVLSPLQCLVARTLEEVLQCVEPGVHGVLIQHGASDAMFLPERWEEFPDGVEFFRALRKHAGLDPDGWSPDIHISVYEVQQLPRRTVNVPSAPVGFMSRRCK